MNADDARRLVERHWHTANARDWPAFAALLHAELVYEVPQTRERIRGRDGYVDFFRTWPGPWRADIRRLIAEPDAAVTTIDFVTPDETMTGITFFELADGLIRRVTDHWPTPYEPPPRASAFVERY